MRCQPLFLIVLGACILTLANCNSKESNTDELSLADASVVWWMAPGIIADKEKIYENNGLTVNTFNVQTGLASKNAVLSGSADIGLVASTPLALGAFSQENLIVLCSYVESSDLIALVSTTPGDTARYVLPQTPVAIVKGTISELYFYNYLSKYFPDKKEAIIKDQLNVKPADVANTVKSGDAKSGVIWEPYSTMLAQSDTAKYKVTRAPDVYTHRIYIVTTPEALARKRTAIEKFVKSFQQASDLIKKEPEKAKKILGDNFPPQKASMNLLWDKVSFDIKVDYDNMKDLIFLDAQTAYQLKQTPAREGQPRQLKPTDLDFLFRHNFKLK